MGRLDNGTGNAETRSRTTAAKNPDPKHTFPPAKTEASGTDSINQANRMNEDRQLTIHFNNGTKMDVTFPAQVKNSTGALVEAAKRILEADKLTIQTDEQIVIIPWSSVKYVEASSVPAAALPFGVIKGARIVASPDSSKA